MKSKFIGALERVLLCKMPDSMRQEIERVLADPNSSEYILKSLYEKCTKRLVLAKPREEIGWNPSVDEAKCIGCEACYCFCPHSVYTMRKGKAVVTDPCACVILCSNCMPLCPEGAITFPEQKEYVDFLSYE